MDYTDKTIKDSPRWGFGLKNAICLKCNGKAELTNGENRDPDAKVLHWFRRFGALVIHLDNGQLLVYRSVN